MASARTALRAALGANAAIKTILGDPALPRIFSAPLPTGTSLATTAALTIQQIDRTMLAEQLNGAQQRPVYRFQVTAFSESVATIDTLSDDTITALDDLGGTFDTKVIQVIRFLSGSDTKGYDPETQTHWSTMDFDVQL